MMSPPGLGGRAVVDQNQRYQWNDDAELVEPDMVDNSSVRAQLVSLSQHTEEQQTCHTDFAGTMRTFRLKHTGQNNVGLMTSRCCAFENIFENGHP